MDSISISSDPYEFDLDENGVLALTEGNVKRIDFLINNDSRYRLGADPDNPLSLDSYTKNLSKCKDPSRWKESDLGPIIKMIDIQNSTHQMVTGVIKDPTQPDVKNNEGWQKTAEYICQNINNWSSRLEKEDQTLVHDIALALYKEDGSGRYTFSFASKFCAYMSRALYNSDTYPLYDSVVTRVIPYYAWAYLGENKYFARKHGKIGKVFGIDHKEGDYAGYNALIGRIIEANKEITGYEISRKDFDHLLWYYFKGDWDRKDENKELVHESRTTKALKFVNNEEAILKTCK